MRHPSPACAAALAALALLPACSRSPEPEPAPQTQPAAVSQPTPPPTNPPDAPTPSPRAETPAAPTAYATTPGDVAGLRFLAPTGWAPGPAGGMRAATFTLPVPDDLDAPEPAELVFFHFGPQGAGGVDANLARWASLVLDDNNQPTTPAVEAFAVGDLTVTLAQYEGTYLAGPPQGEKTPKPNSTFLGAIVDGGPQGPVILRLTGPKAVVTAHRGLWDQLLRSAAPAPAAPAR